MLAPNTACGPPSGIRNRARGDYGSRALAAICVRRSGLVGCRRDPRASGALQPSARRRIPWSLAPAFDLNPIPDKERELKTWLPEESGPTGSVDDALAAAPFFQTEEGRAMTAFCTGIATKKRMTLILVHNAG